MGSNDTPKWLRVRWWRVITIPSLILIAFLIWLDRGPPIKDYFPLPTPTVLQASMTCPTHNCWLGIIEGSSSREESIYLLELQYGEENVIQHGNEVKWITRWEVGSLQIDNNDIVTETFVSFPNTQPTIKSLVDSTGEPSFVGVTRAFSSDVLCAGSHVLFPDKGIIAYLNPINDSVGINEGQFISALVFMQEEITKTWAVTDTWTFEWQGYVDYCELAASEHK